ncbi:hypothetical protein ADK75_19105, partial [Streptomyces virginiae]
MQRQFWRLIATRVTTVEASLAVGVSWPVGTRWSRHAGGMPPISLAEPTGRYLSLEEREEIAILRAKGTGVRRIDAAEWKGRKMKPHRADRRWATAWSPQQISHRVTLDFPDDE